MVHALRCPLDERLQIVVRARRRDAERSALAPRAAPAAKRSGAPSGSRRACCADPRRWSGSCTARAALSPAAARAASPARGSSDGSRPGRSSSRDRTARSAPHRRTATGRSGTGHPAPCSPGRVRKKPAASGMLEVSGPRPSDCSSAMFSGVADMNSDRLVGQVVELRHAVVLEVVPDRQRLADLDSERRELILGPDSRTASAAPATGRCRPTGSPRARRATVTRPARHDDTSTPTARVPSNTIRSAIARGMHVQIGSLAVPVATRRRRCSRAQPPRWVSWKRPTPS